ncbi:MAG TPA: hypothetical protein DEP87_04015 [Candidatus Pacebacteria bacterium]|nr:hypothetical protein [Candidatus Paceibacterota bacterium]
MANFQPQIKLPFSLRWLTIILLLGVAVGMSWQLIDFYQHNFYPQTYINGWDVSNLTVSEAIDQLKVARPSTPAFNLVLSTDTTDQLLVASSSVGLAAKYQYDPAVTEIFATSHQISWQQSLIRLLGLGHSSHATPLSLDLSAQTELIAALAKQVVHPALPATIKLKTSGVTNSLIVDPGTQGQEINLLVANQILQTELNQYSQTWQDPSAWKAWEAQVATEVSISPQVSPAKLTIFLPIEASAPPLNKTQIEILRSRAQKLVGKTLALAIQTNFFYWSDQTLVNLLRVQDLVSEAKTATDLFDTPTLNSELIKINQSLPNQPIDAEFSYDPTTLNVTKFQPGKAGLTLDFEASQNLVLSALQTWIDPTLTGITPSSSPTSKSQTVELSLPSHTQLPTHQLSETNDLGIKELVGYGESYYAHSIPSRIHNVALTAKKINLTIVKSGEEFSFNKTLGEVSAVTGFKPAYVIKSGRTELGDGGGVCQVSSTTFRAALNGGLNITKRLPHSYRVSYYELNNKPGFDATVYAGNVDFRFLNDTPGHLLIYTETDSNKLWMKVEIYGTRDGRTSEISDYKTWGATPAKPTEYIPDASLPTGQKKQIDWSASGLKASFKYTVRDAQGAIKQEETYTSNYHSWAAKYLVGP